MDLYRGHPIEKTNKNGWVFIDTQIPVKDWKNRPCGHCDKPNTIEGHDGCLGTLPNVMNACCGHGVVSSTYVQFDLQNVLRGQEAIDFIESQKCN